MNEARDVRTLLLQLDLSLSRVVDAAVRPRAAFAEASGLARAGVRTTLWLDTAGSLTTVDLCRHAAAASLPLVIRLTTGGDHEAVHAASEQGVVVLVARDPQEAIDLTLVARRVADFAMVPVVVACDLEDAPTCVLDLPSEAVIARTIGRAEDRIGTPTATQRLLFGDRRRRTFRSFDLDAPTMSGARASPRIGFVADAARAAHREPEVGSILVEAMADTARATGRPLAASEGHRHADARIVIVTMGHASTLAIAVANELRTHKQPVGVLSLLARRPLPDREILEALGSAQEIVVLDRARARLDSDSPLAREIGRVLRTTDKRGMFGRGPGPRLRVALAGASLEQRDLARYVDAVRKGDDRELVHLGVDFTPHDPAFPKRQALFDRLRRDRPVLAGLGVRAERLVVHQPARGPARTPRLLLPLTRTSDTHDSLARFWDQVGVLLPAGASAEIAPDPYLAFGTLPPVSAALSAPGAGFEQVAALDASACTGCGACWTACPDGAIAPIVMSARALIEAGMERATRSGRPADALRMLIGKLAARLEPSGRADVGAALREAWTEVGAKAAVDGDRRVALETAFDSLLASIGSLPLAGATTTYGEHLLGLVLDPDACKACGLCVTACEPGAWIKAPRTPERVGAARAAWHCWEDLPDTQGTAIESLIGSGALPRATASSLSRHALLPMASGDAAEPGSGSRLALRVVLGVVELVGQPAMRARLDEFSGLEERFGARIREVLGKALPVADLGALQEGLDALGRTDVALADLALRVDAAVGTGRVDAAALGRLVGTARELADHRFRIHHGGQGLGRARCGLLILGESELDWARTFPDNPFASPVTVDDLDVARGLAEGQVELWLDDLRLLRRARLELERPHEAIHAQARLRALGLADLDAKERRGCPPLVVVGSARRLLVDQLGDLLALLQCDLPVLVVAVGDATAWASLDTSVVALAARQRYVAQCSVGDLEHLFAATADALRSGSPALVAVHAPSPRRDDIASDRTLSAAREAVAQRAVSLFTYDPARSPHLGARFDLAGNPELTLPSVDAARGERREARWRTLLELAGVESPASERMRAAVEAEAREASARESEGLRASFEQDLSRRLAEKLTTLALRGRR